MTAVLAGSVVGLAVGVAAAALHSGGTRTLPTAVGTIASPGGSGSRLWRTLVVTAALAVALTVLLRPLVTVFALAASVAVVMTRRRRIAAAARRAIDEAMPDATELMVVCLHAGLTPTQAVAELAGLAPAALRPAFTAVEQRLHRGAGFVDALGELVVHCGSSATALVSAMSAAVRDGLPLAPVLDRLTDEANASRRRNGEAAARRLPVRLTFPLVVCTLPSFVLLAIAPAVLGALSTVRGSAP